MITKLHNNKVYLLSTKAPNTGDLVLTDNYGVWTFHEGTAPIPYWCNPNACKKVIRVRTAKIRKKNK
jgi:hypothetical protein